MIDRICIIALFSILFFSKTLTYKYCSDDLPAYHRPKNPNKWLQWLFVLEGRARSHPQPDHALTMLIHTLTCVFIYTGFGASDVSFLAALLFCVNPINNQVSVWIAGRAYGLVAMGMTLVMTVPLLAPLVLLGVAYYNSGFMAPLIFLASPHPFVVGAMPLAWLMHWRRFKVNVGDKVKMEMLPEDREFKWQKLVLATKTFGFYTLHSIIPIKNSFYHSFMQSAAGSGMKKAYAFCRFFYIGLAFILFIGWYILTHPWGLASFGLLWWCFCLLPFCNLFRIHQEIAERYAYLPNVGLMLFLAGLLVHSPIWTAVFLAMYATKLWFFMDCYQDEYYLIEYACLHSPDAWFGWHVRGMKRWEVKSYQEAVIMWTMARMISPKEYKINHNLATALALSANPAHREEAKAFLKIAMDNVPRGQEETAKKYYDEWMKGQYTIVL